MRYHQHYLSWTIEWEKSTTNKWIFYLCRDLYYPYEDTSSHACMQLGLRNDVEKGISQSQSLIDNIITEQNKIAEKIVQD
jgi:hypothetical protein